MIRILFSAASVKDRRAITAYTVDRFGVQQARKLVERLRQTLERLAEIPSLGRSRPDLDPPGHAFRYFPAMRTFIVVYEPSPGGIRVARILHGARDLATELSQEPGQLDPPDVEEA